MRFCPKCKKNYEDDVTFCLEDGTVLKPLDSSEKSGEETLVLPSDAIPPTQMWKDDNKTHQKKSKQKTQPDKPLPKTQIVSNKPASNSFAPLVIIGLVLVVAIGGGWWLYKSSTNKPTGGVKPNTNTTANRAATPDNSAQRYASAPPGAQPPNMLGSPTSAVTVEEFADFQCPTCARMHPVSKQIISAYGSRIKFVFRNFPLAIPAHDKAYDASVAAEAAGLQGKFWDMQNQLFINQSSWSTSTDFRAVLEQYAQKIGLDVEKFKNDMAGMTAKSRVDADLARGRAVGVSSTPTFLINGKPVLLEQMDIASMRALIDVELAKAQSGNQTAPASSTANTNTGNK